MSKTVILSKVKKAITVTYKVTGNSLCASAISKINDMRSIKHRIKGLCTGGYHLQYVYYTNLDLKNNLIMVDSFLPEILAYAVIYYYCNGVLNMADILKQLIALNPLQYNQSLGHKFYERKIKSFLSEIVLGFTHFKRQQY
ncbi:HpaII family restriction endonuclease [Mucilaginibacter antarcticus]|uniref:HpaII family restriction endonuclease n=1 Tax=Mucilaginibacter antarcticus TaxID=1855725 RepID=UPI0036404D08